MTRFFSLILSFCFVAAQGQEAKLHSIYDFRVKAVKGGTIDFAQFKGKKILIVNTPAEADNSPRYAEFEAMYKKYKEKVVVVGFLDEDFGTPPGSRKSGATVKKNYEVSFPLAAKVLVRGKDMAPIYKWLTEKKYNKLKDSEIKWDFQKYLINEQGVLVAVFDPKIKAESAAVIAAIEK